MKPNTKGHLRAISVLDASSFQPQATTHATNFTNRHGSHSQNRKAIIGKHIARLTSYRTVCNVAH